MIPWTDALGWLVLGLLVGFVAGIAYARGKK